MTAIGWLLLFVIYWTVTKLLWWWQDFKINERVDAEIAEAYASDRVGALTAVARFNLARFAMRYLHLAGVFALCALGAITAT